MSSQPFRVGKPATGPHFYGRVAEIDLTMKSDDWIWICGPRRVGKTSVLKFLAEDAKNKESVPLELDLARYKQLPLNGADLLEKTVSRNKRILSQNGVDASAVLESGTPVDGFETLVNEFVDNGLNLWLIWDEAELLLKTQESDPDFLDQLGAALLPIDGFRFVVGSWQGFAELSQRASMFRDAFFWVPLSGLETPAATSLICRQEIGGWLSALDEDVIHRIVDWCGGNPFMLQRLGAEISRESNDDGGAVNDQLIDASQRKIVVDPVVKNTIIDDFEKLTDRQQGVLSRVMRSESVSSDELRGSLEFSGPEVDDAVAFLECYGYLRHPEASDIRLNSRFYAEFAGDVNGGQKRRSTNAGSVQSIRRNIFISYSHKNHDACDRLKSNLQPLLRGREITLWDDQLIEAGDQWRDEIVSGLELAQVAVLLVSQSFLDSDFITAVELPRLLKKAQQAKCRILVFHVEHTVLNPKLAADDESALDEQLRSLLHIQSINDPSNPLSGLSDADQQKCLADAAHTIVKAAHGAR